MNDTKELARLLTLNVSVSDIGKADRRSIDRKNRRDTYEMHYMGMFNAYGLSLIPTRSFADLEALLATGNFDVGIIFCPEFMSENERKRLDEFIPSAAALVKGLVLLTDLHREAFSAEKGQYGYVVKIFALDDYNLDDLRESVLNCLVAPDTRPNIKFDPPWEQAARSFTKSFAEWPPKSPRPASNICCISETSSPI